MTTLPLTEHKRNMMRAWLDGKTIQNYAFGTWIDLENVPAFTSDDNCYRIKPTPTRRFWRPEEIPVGWQIRSVDGTQSGVIGCVTHEGYAYTIGDSRNITPKNFKDYEVAPPGPANAVTWVPAGVEE